MSVTDYEPVDGVDGVEATNPTPEKVVDSDQVWASLITNLQYLSGLLTLDFALKQTKSRYPLVALYTDSFPEEGHRALDARGIPKKRVRYLLPNHSKEYKNETRFYETWSKLSVFSLVEYDRVVLLDSDMVIRRNMDELMDLELDSPDIEGKGDRVFAASHACVCNPNKKPHYPKTWVPANCAFTTQHSDPDGAQYTAASSTSGLGVLNSGLIVARPSAVIYNSILKQLTSPVTQSYSFPDQDLLSDLYRGRWVAIPYIYNALKTLRRPSVHGVIWRDDEVKNVHLILERKPWDDTEGQESDECNKWWWQINRRRLDDEKSEGLEDGH